MRLQRRNFTFCSVFLIGLWCVLNTACTSNTQETKKINEVETLAKTAKDSCDNWLANFLQDSLFSSPVAEFEYFPEHSFYFLKKIRTPKGFFGITANPPFFLATYDCDPSGNWSRLTCTPVEGGSKYEPKWLDVNFDQYLDFVVDVSDGGVHGNHFVFTFLFDKEQQSYRRDTLFELENLSLDPTNKLLRSQHYSSVCGGNVKQLYQVQRDSLIFLEEVTIQGCYGDSSLLHWAKAKNGVLKTDSMLLKPGEAWKRFNGMLWKST